MNRSAMLDYECRDPLLAATHAYDDDPRWQVTQRVIASQRFARSPLLSKLLLHVVAETLHGRSSKITEHRLGVEVFGRPLAYRTVDDNIVRNYARQLRKRLAEHFAEEGSIETLRIHIPVGGYVPSFSETDLPSLPSNAQVLSIHPAPYPSGDAEAQGRFIQSPSRMRGALILSGYFLLLISMTWLIARRAHVNHAPQNAAHPLWTAMFQGAANCYIVPADAGLNLMEDLSHRPVTLAGYLEGNYGDSHLTGIDGHSADDLRKQQFTSFVDVEVVTSLARLPEFNTPQVSLRFPRDLRLDDLKNSNAVIIGSVTSNPWAAISSDKADFEISTLSGMSGSVIVDKHPPAGSPVVYASHWNQPAHETFALISFLPNLSGTGHVLLMQGLDAAGTQAAAETLFRSDDIAPIIRNASLPDGSLRPFEILIRTISMQSSALNTRIASVRLH